MQKNEIRPHRKIQKSVIRTRHKSEIELECESTERGGKDGRPRRGMLNPFDRICFFRWSGDFEPERKYSLKCASDLQRRLRELNRSEALPYAFRAYATYEVSHKLTDKVLHELLDKLNPDIETFDGRTVTSCGGNG